MAAMAQAGTASARFRATGGAIRRKVRAGRSKAESGARINFRRPKEERSSPNEKWGPALLPAPICAERRIRRCSSALATRRPPAPRSWLTSSGVASEKWIPIRRRVPLRFRGPSWTDPLSRRSLPEGGRVSRKKDWLFRRLFQLVRTGTEILVHRLPVEIGPSAPSSSLCVVAGASGEAGTSVPIT